MEIDVDDVPWKDDLVSEVPEIVRGEMVIPCKPGWGTEPDERELRRRAWGDPVVQVAVPDDATAASPDGTDAGPSTAYDRIMGPWSRDDGASEADDE